MDVQSISPYNSYIYSADLDGASAVYIELPHSLGAVHFAATPDGKAIFMDGYYVAPDYVSELVSVDVNTLSTAVITTALNCFFEYLGVSPDGNKIVASSFDNSFPVRHHRLHVMNIDGSDSREVYLFHDRNFYTDISHSVSNGWVYSCSLSTARETDIFRINMTGTIIENLTNTPLASESNPIVRPGPKENPVLIV